MELLQEPSDYDEMNDDTCNLNTIIENNNTQFWTNRRHSLHSMDYVRKLNDLAKQFKKHNKNKLETKRLVVNKSNSSSIGIGLNINSANSSHKSSNESLNRKTTVNQYAKLTLKSILQKPDSKKKIEKTNFRNEKFNVFVWGFGLLALHRKLYFKAIQRAILGCLGAIFEGCKAILKAWKASLGRSFGASWA